MCCGESLAFAAVNREGSPLAQLPERQAPVQAATCLAREDLPHTLPIEKRRLALVDGVGALLDSSAQGNRGLAARRPRRSSAHRPPVDLWRTYCELVPFSSA